MRILDVSGRAAHPIDTGGLVRIHSLLSHLSRRHEIRQFCLGSLSRPLRRAVKETPVTPTFRVVSYATPLTAAAVGLRTRLSDSRSVASRSALRFMRTSRLAQLSEWADLTLLEGPWLLGACRGLDAPLVLAMHNDEIARFRSYAKAKGQTTGRGLRQIEQIQGKAIAAASLITAVSEEDRHSFVERHGADPERTIVVENGADTERYRPTDALAKAALKQELGLPPKRTVVFLGSRFPPNTAALSWIHRAARATDRFTFLVVGAVSRPGVQDNVIATGRVPDIAPYLQAADFSVCPVQYGAGTKVKLFEALAAGLPTVVFGESLCGTSFVDGEHVLVAAKSERDVVARLHELEGDAALAARLAGDARALVVARHDWRRSAAVLDEALRQLIGEQEHRLTYRASPRSEREAAV